MGLLVQGIHQGLHFLAQVFEIPDHGHLAGRRDDVIGRLAHIDVVVGVEEGIVSLLPTQLFNGNVGNDLVSIHVERGSCTTLNGISDELIQKLAI